MRRIHIPPIAIAVVVAAGTGLVADQQGRGAAPAQWPLSNTVRERGSSVTGAFEGWFYDGDGGQNLLVGYFNRNTKQELDVPIGPNNRIEPGGPDFGQPTHFLPGRQWGVFAIKLPKNFGATELTWTIVSNGQTNAITMHTRPDWIVQPFEDPANKNTPPVIAFERGGSTFAGPPAAIAATFTATAGVPLPLVSYATDEGPKINVVEPPRRRAGSGSPFPIPPKLSVWWALFRGPGAVTFDTAKPAIEGDGKSTATATFAVPGDYVLRLQGNDSTGDGGGGFQCCWTSVHVAVKVKPAGVATSPAR